MLIWCDDRPTWRELQPWAQMMGYTFTAWELRVLKQISNAYFAAVTEAKAD